MLNISEKLKFNYKCRGVKVDNLFLKAKNVEIVFIDHFRLDTDDILLQLI